MMVLKLPRLIGSREAAVALVAQALPADASGEPVEVDCRDLVSASRSFADELVEQLLVARRVADIVLLGASPQFADLVREAAVRRDLGRDVHLAPLSGAGIRQ